MTCFLCWLFGGHHTILRTEAVFERVPLRALVRVWTECTRCGRESRGWRYGELTEKESVHE